MIDSESSHAVVFQDVRVALQSLLGFGYRLTRFGPRDNIDYSGRFPSKCLSVAGDGIISFVSVISRCDSCDVVSFRRLFSYLWSSLGSVPSPQLTKFFVHAYRWRVEDG